VVNKDLSGPIAITRFMEIALGIAVLWLALLGLYIYRQNRNDTFDVSRQNGSGLALYGKRDVNPDGSYIATKFFVLFLLPIVPVASYKIWRSPRKEIKGFFDYPRFGISFTENLRYERVSLQWPQIVNVYLCALPVYLLLLWGIYKIAII
jgi:hypothetical protein